MRSRKRERLGKARMGKGREEKRKVRLGKGKKGGGERREKENWGENEKGKEKE